MDERDKRAAADQVVEHIRGLIERGELRPGQRVTAERDLARELGISRPSVRSGLQALAAMGIVQVRQGAGTFITSGPPMMAGESLNFLAALHGFTQAHLFEARVILESTVAALAAERARTSPDRLMTIGDEITGMFASVDAPEVFAEHDHGFHRAVAAIADNPALAAILEMMASMFPDRHQAGESSPRELKERADEHRTIYQAIRAYDAERARQAMTRHLQLALAAPAPETVPSTE